MNDQGDMKTVAVVLRYWFDDWSLAAAHRIHTAWSFSGADIWRVEHRGAQFALRRWPPIMDDGNRLASIHAYQRQLVARGIGFVPAPVLNRAGADCVRIGGNFWELLPWMPGEADDWSNPRPQKLEAALQALARVHIAGQSPQATLSVSPALLRRVQLLEELHDSRLRSLRTSIQELPDGADAQTASEALDLIKRAISGPWRRSRVWRNSVLPIQWRLGDIRHEHVLLTGDRVTGIIDFGAADIDAPAGDVGQLLGSLVGDDRALRKKGLEAYQALRSLSLDELAAIEFFDSSGVVLAAANWIEWIFVRPDALPSTVDHGASWQRFEAVLTRLRVLANPPL